MLDLNTLVLMTGAGNLLFALLLTLYMSPTAHSSPAFDYWRRAKYLMALASLLTVLRPWLPLPLALHGAHATHFVSWTLELMAYRLFLGKTTTPRAVPVVSGTLIVIHLLLLSLTTERTPSLISFSLVGAYLEAFIAFTLFRSQRPDKGLTRLLGIISGIGAGIFLTRALFGLYHEGYTTDELRLFNQALFSIGFLHMIGNSFGFLLLTRQENERQLHRALASVSQAERGQRQLLSMASHEFRTPAAMIKASLDSLALLRSEITPEVNKRVNNIHLATERMITLANHLISQDRFQEMAFAPVLEPCELGQLVNDIVGSYSLDAELHFEPPPDPLWIEADPTLLSIALNNLLDNAVRYSRTADGSSLPVEITLIADQHQVRLRVCDHGPGIEDADKDKVFERFYNLRGSPHGGIGLSIVHSVAAAHHGDIRVEDTPGGGATLCLTLPLSTAAG